MHMLDALHKIPAVGGWLPQMARKDPVRRQRHQGRGCEIVRSAPIEHVDRWVPLLVVPLGMHSFYNLEKVVVKFFLCQALSGDLPIPHILD
jgi:hypothetical protein